VLPVTSLTLDHPASTERLSSGLPALDEMLGGTGFYRGSTILLSGTAGTGKTTIAAHFVNAACARGERSLYFLFEESPRQMLRNMRSTGMDLERWVDAGLLEFRADRTTRHGLETHLTTMYRAIERSGPDVVVIDPMTNLLTVGTQSDVRAMLTRLIDFLKMRGVTVVFTSLSPAGADPESTETMISSLMDTWVLTSLEEHQRQRSRWIYVLKARGTAHSAEMRQFRIGGHGVEILPARSRTGEA
jgi:circadian clock protein KaiC